MIPLDYNPLVFEYDATLNKLEFGQSKLNFPEVFNTTESHHEIEQIQSKSEELKDRLRSEVRIEKKREAMFSQLQDYTDYLSIIRPLKYSKSQGMFGHKFYVEPLLNIRDILFTNMNSRIGVDYLLTRDENDAVNDKQNFIAVLEVVKDEILRSSNLLDLYNAFRNFSETLKRDFYRN